MPAGTMDRYTYLRQLGYYGSLAEMEAKYDQNTTRVDTVGEQVYFARDAAEARAALGVTPGGGGVIAPSDLVPSLGNVDNTSDVNKPVSTAQAAAISGKASQASLDTTNSTVSALTTTVSGLGTSKASLAGPTNFTGTTSVVNLVVSGTTSFVDGSIAQAEVAGLVTALSKAGNVFRIIGNVPRTIGGVTLPAAPAVCVDWITVGLVGYPTAFDFNGDTLQNSEA
jgi:hypothetical protein